MTAVYWTCHNDITNLLIYISYETQKQIIPVNTMHV